MSKLLLCSAKAFGCTAPPRRVLGRGQQWITLTVPLPWLHTYAADVETPEHVASWQCSPTINSPHPSSHGSF